MGLDSAGGRVSPLASAPAPSGGGVGAGGVGGSALGIYRTSAATRPSAGFSTVQGLDNGWAAVDENGELFSPERDAEKLRLDARVHKWVLHAAVRHLMPRHATATCCRNVLPKKRRSEARKDVEGVDIWKSNQHGTAHYGNLMTCGFVWSCPICAPKVASRRAVEVEQAITTHQASGGRVAFLTMTVPHYASDHLAELLPEFTEALRSFWSLRATKETLRLVGFAGSIRALEVTHGKNGWHPHTHYLLFIKDCVDLLAIQTLLYQQWENTVNRKLGRQINGHGLTLQLVGGGADQGGTDEDARQLSKYVVKGLEDSIWGVPQEMTGGHIKKGRQGGRTPFALLHDYATQDDDQAGALFVQFVKAFAGRRQLSWSKGLRGQLLGTEVEATDQELADMQVEESTLLGTLTLEQWRRVLRSPRADARGLLLEVAAAGGWSAVETFIETLPEVKRRWRNNENTG